MCDVWYVMSEEWWVMCDVWYMMCFLWCTMLSFCSRSDPSELHPPPYLNFSRKLVDFCPSPHHKFGRITWNKAVWSEVEMRTGMQFFEAAQHPVVRCEMFDVLLCVVCLDGDRHAILRSCSTSSRAMWDVWCASVWCASVWCASVWFASVCVVCWDGKPM